MNRRNLIKYVGTLPLFSLLVPSKPSETPKILSDYDIPYEINRIIGEKHNDCTYQWENGRLVNGKIVVFGGDNYVEIFKKLCEVTKNYSISISCSSRISNLEPSNSSEQWMLCFGQLPLSVRG